MFSIAVKLIDRTFQAANISSKTFSSVFPAPTPALALLNYHFDDYVLFYGN